MATDLLKFVSLQIKIPVNVWSWIGQHKLDQLKLDTGPFHVDGLLLPAAFHRGSGDDSAVELQAGGDLRISITSGAAFDEPAVLWKGLVLVYADLKRHCYSYCAAFPYLKLPQPCRLQQCQPLSAAFPDHAPAIVQALAQEHDWPVLISLPAGGVKSGALKVTPFSDLGAVASQAECERVWPEGLALALLDTSSHTGVLGGAARNVLALLATHFPAATVTLLALCAAHGTLSAEHSQAMTLQLPGGMVPASAPLLGWESSRPHPERPGTRVPVAKVVDLTAALDPAAQAAQALALNLKLMRWRAAPALDLPAIAATHCLLLGCGTLGCEVARTLVAWGVHKLTLVDNGRVAFSNPARQSLFQVEDCIDGGAPKAEAAAAALRRIAPELDVTSVPLTIRMPGHPPVTTEVEQAIKDVEQLDGLVREADAIFLLTDSRESRWLPTLLAATHNKLLLNAALGFDSWVAMRHGVLAPPPAEADASTAATAAAQPARLGCYFCNDVVAPANSLAGRSMDEQCTVVRPGLARVAGATAVEMLAALVQHPAGAAAPAGGPGPAGAVLGGVPHMVRGTLMGFEQAHMTGSANPVCSACSDGVVEVYQQRGAAFVLDVIQGHCKLDAVSGLAELRVHTTPADDGDGGIVDDEDDWEAL